MQLFLCHTPLHLLISLLVAQKNSSAEKLIFAVIEDSQGLHALAQKLVVSKNIDLLLLPGAANTQSLLKSALIHRANAKHLHDTYARAVDTVFIFHDLRAESQKLLNSEVARHTGVRFVLLEDGVALYEPGGFLVDGFVSILKRKIFWDIRWKHARELGLHPRLSEIQCFYPELLRSNLRHLCVKSLPKHLAGNISAPSLLKAPLSNAPFCIVAVPHFAFGENFIREFLISSRDYCFDRRLNLLLKLHPRDMVTKATIEQVISSPVYLPQELPLEVLLLSIPKAAVLIGSRTSALHVANVLQSNITCLYFDKPSTVEGVRWINFFTSIGIGKIQEPEEEDANINIYGV
ncbi:MAG: hypothetical protein J0H59_04770 [Comamonadaceae bacterium]|nr:hypothetical protein [Comamonadaceae bacterium]